MISDDTDVPVNPETAVDDTVPLENDTTEEAAEDAADAQCAADEQPAEAERAPDSAHLDERAVESHAVN